MPQETARTFAGRQPRLQMVKFPERDCTMTEVKLSGATARLSRMRPQLSGWARAFVALGRSGSGSVAINFAIAILPIVLSVGAAVDYSIANRAKSGLDAAADAAALSAVSKAAMSLNASDAKKLAIDMFNAQAQQVAGASVSKLTVTVNDGSTRTSVVTYEASVPTNFMPVIGLNQIAVGGTSNAASGLLTYIDFYLLLDNTPSMGVGATTADINKMVANTSDKCAFACHDLSASPNDYYGLAKKLGVAMRIDVVRQATQQLMDTAAATQAVTGQFRMAIYTFGAAATNAGLTTIQSLTSSLSTAKTAAASIDLMTVPYQNYKSDTLTDFHGVLGDLNSAIPTPGDGTKASSPLKYLFFVSDGVADRALGSPSCSQPTTNGKDPKTGTTYVRCQEPLDVKLCTTMKNRGIKIAVLYTTYLPLPTNSWYTTWIAPFSGTIAKNMQSCASPGLYFEVSPTEGISDAMTALFQKAVQQARLTK
jgi:Flp pilus assembly protein TadG